jgi:LysR family transcriptional regulator for bpeEF and oprC
MRMFIRVVETTSFSKAAKAEGIGQPSIGKHIAALEARLGAQLLRRTSRGLSMTEAGEAFYESAIRLLDDVDEAEARVGRGQLAPAGRIRVAMSPGFGRMHILPRLPEFFGKYPGITVETDISNRFINLIERRIDVAIRIGSLSDSSLLARKIGSGETALLATPEYLRRKGTPATPADLASHDCVIFVSGGAARPWPFEGPDGPITIHPEGPVRTSDAEHIRVGVLSGLGLAQGPAWLFLEELKSGAVVRLLPDYAPARHSIYAVSPGGRYQSRKVTVFVDFVARVFAGDPQLRPA